PAPATPQLHTLSLHDALPISSDLARVVVDDQEIDGILAENAQRLAGRARRQDEEARALELALFDGGRGFGRIHQQNRDRGEPLGDRKSTRLNSSHVKISYAVF